MVRGDGRRGCDLVETSARLRFHDTLVDADAAINAFMWQNGGVSGVDQWNFVMHPVHAAKACDPEGDYVRRWVPELAMLPKEHIHAPWAAPGGMTAGAGISLVHCGPSRPRSHAALGLAPGGVGGTRGPAQNPRPPYPRRRRDPSRRYPRRIVEDLSKARKAAHAAVLAVRASPEGRPYVLADGSEWLELRDGRKVRLITRVDFREGKLQTFQTPDEFRDPRRRRPEDPFRGILHDAAKAAEA